VEEDNNNNNNKGSTFKTYRITAAIVTVSI